MVAVGILGLFMVCYGIKNQVYHISFPIRILVFI